MAILAENKGKRAGEAEPPAYDENPWRAAGASSSGGRAPTAAAASGSTTATPTATARNVVVAANRDVTCTDETVNKDVNAMYNFLLSQTSIPPRITCRIVGKHKETRIEEQLVEDTTYRNGNRPSPRAGSRNSISRPSMASDDEDALPRSPASGGLRTPVSQPASHARLVSDEGETHVRRTQTKKQVINTVEVTAFDFSIDLTQNLLPRPVLWTAPDEELVYRGGALKERWVGHTDAQREGNDIEGDQSLLKSTKSLKTWVKYYVDRAGPLKEFEWSKGVDGWDWTGIREAIKGSILRSGYSGNVTVSFDLSGRHVFVRPPGLWSSMYSDAFGNVLLWASLVRPYLMFYYKEGRWAIGGEVWHLRRGDEGLKEGEWFRFWESTIERAVEKRMTIKEVLKRPWSESPGTVLEGYNG